MNETSVHPLLSRIDAIHDLIYKLEGKCDLLLTPRTEGAALTAAASGSPLANGLDGVATHISDLLARF
jgi:hypothetical protein